MRDPVVSNASPLIALEQIGQLDLLRSLFNEVLIPPAVSKEIASSVALPEWIVERTLTQPIGPQTMRTSLGPGESEAISLALEIDARWLIVDERAARRTAQALGIPVIGTLGILLAAKRRNLLPTVKPCLDALMSHDFRIASDLYEQVLSDAGESD
jgi:predicted nucleic acid-binding protein